jgi:hypothetical protein
MPKQAQQSDKPNPCKVLDKHQTNKQRPLTMGFGDSGYLITGAVAVVTKQILAQSIALYNSNQLTFHLRHQRNSLGMVKQGNLTTADG